MSIESGFVLIYKSIMDSDIVGFEKPYSKAEAWIWMLLEACRKPEGREVYRRFGNKERLVFEPYGCLCHSERFLQKAWGWSSRKKIETFLKRLESGKKVERKLSQQITVISICKFDTYQNPGASKRASKEPVKSQQGASKEPNYNTLTRKHVNTLALKDMSDIAEKSTSQKPKKSCRSQKLTPSQIAEQFFKAYQKPALRGEQYEKYAGKFPSEEEVGKFVGYWTQENDRETPLWKIKKRKGGVWTLHLRIATWVSNYEKKNSNGRNVKSTNNSETARLADDFLAELESKN